MSEITDGGPAFPGVHAEEIPIGGPGWQSTKIDERRHLGMSLRDYFAAAALTGLSRDAWLITSGIEARVASEFCYSVADAMLLAREKK